MIADIILGNNIDTNMWIYDLKKLKSENIGVLDYEYQGEAKIENNVYYFSITDARIYIEKFDTVNFYKSMYGYPGRY